MPDYMFHYSSEAAMLAGPWNVGEFNSSPELITVNFDEDLLSGTAIKVKQVIGSVGDTESQVSYERSIPSAPYEIMRIPAWAAYPHTGMIEGYANSLLTIGLMDEDGLGFLIQLAAAYENDTRVRQAHVYNIGGSLPGDSGTITLPYQDVYADILFGRVGNNAVISFGDLSANSLWGWEDGHEFSKLTVSFYSAATDAQSTTEEALYNELAGIAVLTPAGTGANYYTTNLTGQFKGQSTNFFGGGRK